MSCENKTVTIDGVEYKLTPVQAYKTVSLHKMEYKARGVLVSENEMTWQDAVTWCTKQGGRLATVAELHAYRNQLKYALGDKANNYFWSGDEYSTNTTSAWYVYLGYGSTTNPNMTASYNVVCVRN